MSTTLDRLANSEEKIDRELAAVLRYWQDIKAQNGHARSLGYGRVNVYRVL